MTCGNLITEGIIYLTAARGPHPALASWRKKKNVRYNLGSLIKSERWARLDVCINQASSDGVIRPANRWRCRLDSLTSPANPQAFHPQRDPECRLARPAHSLARASVPMIGDGWGWKLESRGGAVSGTRGHFDEHECASVKHELRHQVQRRGKWWLHAISPPVVCGWRWRCNLLFNRSFFLLCSCEDMMVWSRHSTFEHLSISRNSNRSCLKVTVKIWQEWNELKPTGMTSWAANYCIVFCVRDGWSINPWILAVTILTLKCHKLFADCSLTSIGQLFIDILSMLLCHHYT